MRISQLPIEATKTDPSGLSSGMEESLTYALAIFNSVNVLSDELQSVKVQSPQGQSQTGDVASQFRNALVMVRQLFVMGRQGSP